MVTPLIVWGALPFVAITLYAGLAQVPARARRGGGDRRRAALARLPRHHAPDPEADLLDPHEPLDHLGLRRLHAAVPADRPVARSTRQLPDEHLPLRRGRTSRATSAAARRSRSLMLADRRDAQRLLHPPDGADRERGDERGASQPRAPDRLGRSSGVVVFVVMVFPVFWMVSTAFKPDDEIISLHADVDPAAPDARPLPRRDQHGRTSGRTSRTA